MCLLLCAGTACSREAPAVARVDGGTDEVALLGLVVTPGQPGGSLTVEHVGEPSDGEEAPTTHAFVVPAEDGTLPPVFVRRSGGLAPNAAVWGACRGGRPSDATDGCPIPPIEGPQGWNGEDYWSTGALLRSESTEVPLAGGISTGDHELVCALHPRLRIAVRVGAAAPEPTQRDVEADIADALAFAQSEDPHRGPEQVTAGVSIGDDAYVARFVPEEIRIPVGGTVTWRAGGRTPVDVVFGADHEELSLAHTEPAHGLSNLPASRSWDGRGEVHSGFLSADPTAGGAAATWSVTFTRSGTYEYASRFGPTLHGRVVVE